MLRREMMLGMAAVGLAACDSSLDRPLGANGMPLPSVYRISAGDTATVQFRMLDSVNSLRRAAGVQEVQLNASLNAAAATHSRDMSVQNRQFAQRPEQKGIISC